MYKRQEQYSAIQLDSHFNELSFEELRNELTNYVKDKYCPDELEKVLQQKMCIRDSAGTVGAGEELGKWRTACNAVSALYHRRLV